MGDYEKTPEEKLLIGKTESLSQQAGKCILRLLVDQ